MASRVANQRRTWYETGTSTLILLQHWVKTAEKWRNLITWIGSIQYETIKFQHSVKMKTGIASSKYGDKVLSC